MTYAKIFNILTNRFTDSMTSRKTSFFLYLMPSDRHDTALVTAMGGRGATSSLCPSWVMYLKTSIYTSGNWKKIHIYIYIYIYIYIHQGIGSSLVQVMAWCQLGTKPLPKPVMTYCQLDTNLREIWIETNIFFEENTFGNVYKMVYSKHKGPVIQNCDNFFWFWHG